MAEIRFFMMPDRANSIFKDIMKRYDLSSFIAKKNKAIYELISCNDLMYKSNTGVERYILGDVNKGAFKELRPFVNLWLPRLENGTLLMSSLAISKNRYDDMDEIFKENKKIFITLKKELVKVIDMGLYALNPITGGDHIYRDVGIDKTLKEDDIILKQNRSSPVEYRRLIKCDEMDNT